MKLPLVSRNTHEFLKCELAIVNRDYLRLIQEHGELSNELMAQHSADRLAAVRDAALKEMVGEMGRLAVHVDAVRGYLVQMLGGDDHEEASEV